MINSQGAKRKKKVENQRTLLVQLLVEAQRSLSPEELFRRAGLQSDDVDEFYEELREAISNGRIKEVRPDAAQVLLEAVRE